MGREHPVSCQCRSMNHEDYKQSYFNIAKKHYCAHDIPLQEVVLQGRYFMLVDNVSTISHASEKAAM